MNFQAIIFDISDSLMLLLLAISAIAAIKVLPGVSRWGFSQVINWFSVAVIFQAGVIHPLKPAREIKNRSARSASVHPVNVPAVESNLPPESRFKVFGVIYGFFGSFFTKLFSFFRRK